MNKALWFYSLVSTRDSRLTRGVLYRGKLVSTPEGIRVLLFYDNKHQRMTFDPKVFGCKELPTKKDGVWK